MSSADACLLLVISQAQVVWADETPLRVLEVKKTKTPRSARPAGPGQAWAS